MVLINGKRKPLTQNFNLSHQTGQFPDSMKTAKLKTGDKMPPHKLQDWVSSHTHRIYLYSAQQQLPKGALY